MNANRKRATRAHKSKPAPRANFTHRPGIRRIKVGAREVITEGIATGVFQDLFHYFMAVGWPQLFVSFGAFFLAFDVLFGLLYHLVPGCLANLNPPGFAGAFFFSVETFATVGYGDMHPQTLYGHIVAMCEIFVGLMSLALITGIMFARFSRPTARFLFTRNLVVRPIDGKLTLVVRAANMRQNVVQDASAQFRMLRNEVTGEGFRIRRVVDLALLRSQHPMFFLGWTIMHVIDEASPLAAETADSLQKSGAAFVLSLSGTDETTGQFLMARAEYQSSDIRWNSTFHDILEEAADGSLHLDYSKFHDIELLRDIEAQTETTTATEPATATAAAAEAATEPATDTATTSEITTATATAGIDTDPDSADLAADTPSKA